MRSWNDLRTDNATLLRQALELVGGLDPEDYCRPGVAASPVGSHLRHCLDFYRCFVDGAPAGRVDYDLRARSGAIERRRDAGLAALVETIEALEGLDLDAVEALEVRHDNWRPEEEAPWCPTSVGRELQFLLGHTVHHYALIAMVLRSFGLEVAAEFGVAPSTLSHRQAITASSETASR